LDIFQLKIWIPDKNNLFATLNNRVTIILYSIFDMVLPIFFHKLNNLRVDESSIW